MCTSEATYSRVSIVAGSGMISWCRFFVFKYKGGDELMIRMRALVGARHATVG